MARDIFKDLAAAYIAIKEAGFCSAVFEFSFAGALLTMGAFMMINYFSVALVRGILGGKQNGKR
jgi:hypothetical protein